MTNKLTCSKCNSEKVVPRVRIKGGGEYGPELGDITAVTYENPDAMVFKNSHQRALHARICGECGHAELFVENPEELYEAYKKSQAS